MANRVSERKRCEPRTRADRAEIALPVLDEQVRAGKVRASRTSRWRALSLIVVHVLIIAHVIHWRLAGRTLSPVEPSHSMDTIRDGLVNAGFIFFALAILATLILGRFVCGWGCHMIAVQDLCASIMKRCGIRPKPFRSRLLVFVPLIAALYMFVWPAVYRWLFPAPEFPGFTSHMMTEDFWGPFPGWAVAIPFVLVCGAAMVYFLGSKGLCTYGCPYGGFFGLADQVAPGRIRVTDDCEQCGHCTAACTSNVKVHAEVRDYGMVVDPGCMKCMDCVSVCPNDALYFGFGKPALSAAAKQAPPPRKYDLSGGEEFFAGAFFLVSFIAFRGMMVTRQEAIPFLMALGMAGCLPFLVIKLLHLFRRSNVSIQNLRLKSAGKLRAPGWVWGVVAVAALGLTGQAAVARYHLFFADRYFAQTQFDEERVLTESGDIAASLDAELRSTIDAAAQHLRAYDRWGWLELAGTRMRLAWLALLQADRERALSLLNAASEMEPDSPSIRYYRGSVLSSLGRFSEAIDDYRAVISTGTSHDETSHGKTPKFDVFARFKLGNALAETNDLDGAIGQWRKLLDAHPDFALAHHNLAGALRMQGDISASIEHYRRALDSDPDNADAHLQLGVTLTHVGRPDLASSHFEAAIKLDPRYSELIEAPSGM